MENFQTIEEAESALNPNQYISINSDGTFRVLDKDTEGKWIAACMYAYAKAGIPFPVDRYKLEEIPPDATTVSDTSAFLPPQTTTEPSSDSESNAAQEQSEQESNPPAEENLDVSLQEVQNNGRNSKTAKVAIVISIVVILFIIVFSLFGLNNNPSPTNTSSSAEQSQERVSKTELNNMIKRSELRDLSLYSEDSAKKFKAALDEAKVISSKDDASGSEIEKAAKSLDEATLNLVKISSDEKSKQEAKIEQSKSQEKSDTKKQDSAPAQPKIKSYSAGIYKVGSDLPAGEYLLRQTGKTMAYYCVYPDSSKANIIGNENFENQAYVTVYDGQILEVTRATMISSADSSPTLSTTPKSGVYKVGVDIAAGEYKLSQNGSTMAYYAVNDNSDADSNIVSNNNFEGQDYVTVYDGQFLSLSRCTGELIQ